MRRFVRLLVAAVVVLVPLMGAHAAGAQIAVGEHVQSYDENITIETNGTLRIVETITYNFGVVPKHGIFRGGGGGGGSW